MDRVIDINSVILALAVLAASVNCAWAQQQGTQAAVQQTVGMQQPTRPKKPFVRNKKEFEVVDLKTPPDLPNLPAYPANPKHGEFMSAQCAPNTLNGQMYTLSYQSKDPGERVLQWYEQVFKTYGWNAMRTGMMINADKDGNRCQVFLLRAVHKEFKTNFVIIYTLSPPKKSGA